jgi:hypothetical protein
MNIIKKNVVSALITFLVLLVLYTTYVIAAAPVADRILENVEIIDDIHRSEVTIQFSIPIRYEKHFPLYKGKELRIRLRPLRVSAVDLAALFQRESIVPRPTDLVPLEEVIYDGDFSQTELTRDEFDLLTRDNLTQQELSERESIRRKISSTDFYLRLLFSNNVAFDVEQGKNFRSIVVYVCEKEISRKEKHCLD